MAFSAYLVLVTLIATPAGLSQITQALPWPSMEACEAYMNDPTPIELFSSHAQVQAKSYCASKEAVQQHMESIGRKRPGAVRGGERRT